MATATELKSKLAALQSELDDYIAKNAAEKLTDEERQIVERFRTLPKDTQATFKSLLDNVAEKLSTQNISTSATGNKSRSTDLPKIGTLLSDCTWEQISAVSKAGLGEKYFNIGDRKEITLNGKIGNYLTLKNEKLSVFILHFNYPINGKPSNNIIWGGFKTADGTDVALCDSVTASTDGTICFNMNHNTNGNLDINYGGWKGCDLHYDILGATSQAPSQYNQKNPLPMSVMTRLPRRSPIRKQTRCLPRCRRISETPCDCGAVGLTPKATGQTLMRTLKRQSTP